MPTTMERLAEMLPEHYRLEREIKSGGMATVYLAREVRQDIERPVAIKVLHAEFSSALAIERFLREVSVAANLVHPNILPLLECGRAGGLPYYVMPYVDGGSLRDLLFHNTQLPIAEVVRIGCDVL